MPTETYPHGTVRALLETDLVTVPTREALRSRLGPGRDQPRFFGAGELATLIAACARLLPRPDRESADPALEIDRRLADGESDGWRYDSMPPDPEAYRQGLRGLDESAAAMFGGSFAALEPAERDEVLRAVQRGEAPGEAWARMPSQRFFEELLAELTECHYSHPLAQEEIGYAGMADAHGWQAIGLDELEPHEPRPAKGERP